MRKVLPERDGSIDNRIYDDRGGEWWDPASPFYQMKVAFNPVRTGYIREVVAREIGADPAGKVALDVGCGGGFLTEEIARLGFETFGLDPSEPSLRTAAAHAGNGGLRIGYLRAMGEAIPCKAGVCDLVLCCDVLEHVRDLPRVVSEVARVLRPGGVFCYDTFNRTLLSKLVAIKIAQEWRRWAFMPPHLHAWEMFVKPRELRTLLRLNGLEQRGHGGIVPGASLLRLAGYLRKTARGEWPLSELGRRAVLTEGRSTGVMYIGYAVKTERPEGEKTWTTS